MSFAHPHSLTYVWFQTATLNPSGQFVLSQRACGTAMARYFFDIHDGRILRRDPEGSECDSPGAVRSEAMTTLPLVAMNAIPKGDRDEQAFTVLVRDETGMTVYTASLTFAGLWVGDVPIPEHEEAQ
jgi:hypothetical protein